MNDRQRKSRRLLGVIVVASACASGVAKEPSPAASPAPASPQLADAEYQKVVKPLLTAYCLSCHSTEKQKGDLDLEVFTSLDAVEKHPKVWQGLVEQMSSNEMPPKGKPQPTPAERAQLLAWTSGMLGDLARARAGDPGPVVLRRLSNAEYTYTIRDLTGVESMDPAREFPVDGAAGEGFTNTGQALVMSPALVTKYLDAGKEIAAHAVLQPDGIRFSNKTTRRDWSDQTLAEIRSLYYAYTNPRVGETLSLQGVKVETNDGGLLPLEKYLAAAIEARDAAAAPGGRTADAIAAQHGLRPKYLNSLLGVLNAKEPSPLLDVVRARFSVAKPADVPAIAGEIAAWQKALWQFNSVGHIGKVGGPKAWQEPVNPLVAKQDFQVKPPPSTDGTGTTLYLVTSDAGDGNLGDAVVWQNPRLVAAGKPDILLRDVPGLLADRAERSKQFFATTVVYLTAAAEAMEAGAKPDVATIGGKHSLKPDVLAAWIAYLSPQLATDWPLDKGVANFYPGLYAYKNEAGEPIVLVNAGDAPAAKPGPIPGKSVSVHPGPKGAVIVAWQSPIAGAVTVTGKIGDADPGCGDGVLWRVEHSSAGGTATLAQGVVANGAALQPLGAAPIKPVTVAKGDFVRLVVSPGGSHVCDTTNIDFELKEQGGAGRTWNLAKDVTPDPAAGGVGNPHADLLGNPGVWHFAGEREPGSGPPPSTIPAGSLLAKWKALPNDVARRQVALAVQTLLTAGTTPTDKNSGDAKLYEQLTSIGGPFQAAFAAMPATPATRPAGAAPAVAGSDWGVDPAAFGRAGGQPADAANLYVRAPSIVEVRLPADLAAGYEFVATGTLDEVAGKDGSVQLQVLTTKPAAATGLVAATSTVKDGGGMWTANNKSVSYGAPVLVRDASPARARYEAAYDAFRQWFPAALAYTKIVPTDEVVTLTLMHREDEPFARLMLDEAGRARLDKLWDELRYVSQDAIAMVDVLEQLIQFATQDADPKVFEPLKKATAERAAAFRQRLIYTEPAHLNGVIEFAGRAFRRPLATEEAEQLRSLYRSLRAEELPHDEAIRLMIARVLVAPAFLYRAESPAPGATQAPVSDFELANRLSYFLWASAPDAELRAVAASGKLRDPNVAAAQAMRMLRDTRVRRLATEFACQWIHVYGFDTLDEKSDRHFPTFGGLRSAMYEESIQFFIDMFQRDGSVLSVLDADHTYLNEALAKHYGIPGVTGDAFRRLEGVRKYGRGGILGQAATLAKQSGASRTSPILRGNWVAEVLLGDKLPKPPKDVPQLPEDEANETLTVRQLTEKHTSDPRCASCHARIDAFGFSLEAFDAIGRARDKDLGGRPIDTRAKVMDGTEINGVDGLRDYLLNKRRDAFLRQFCKKLLGYSLGRGVRLSDEPLLAEMQAKLKADGYRIGTAIELVVRSRQFLDVRGREMIDLDD